MTNAEDDILVRQALQADPESIVQRFPRVVSTGKVWPEDWR
jgi:hypothetical protein